MLWTERVDHCGAEVLGLIVRADECLMGLCEVIDEY